MYERYSFICIYQVCMLRSFLNMQIFHKLSVPVTVYSPIFSCTLRAFTCALRPFSFSLTVHLALNVRSSVTYRSVPKMKGAVSVSHNEMRKKRVRIERKQLILHIVNIILIKILFVEFKVYILKQVRKYCFWFFLLQQEYLRMFFFQVIPKEVICAFEIKQKYQNKINNYVSLNSMTVLDNAFLWGEKFNSHPLKQALFIYWYILIKRWRIYWFMPHVCISENGVSIQLLWNF